MKKSLLTITLTLTALASSSFADLGDTYAQSCHRYGGRGTPDQKNHCILWQTSTCYISERFVKNRCVFMLLTPFEGRYYDEGNVGQILAYTSSQQWTHYRLSDGSDDLGEWATADHSIVVALFASSVLHTTQIQIAYRWFMADKGLLNRDDPDDLGSAPVEDPPGASM